LTGPVVTNATCLIALGRIGRVDLLTEVCRPVLAPLAVREEVGKDVVGVEFRAVCRRDLVEALTLQIDDGEANAIALAVELGRVPVVLDDKKARRIAHQMGLRIQGTMGVIIEAKRQGLIPAVRPVLDELKKAGLYSTPALLAEALRLAGEQED
jgi:predicted nucleic acid-binding protein